AGVAPMAEIRTTSVTAKTTRTVLMASASTTGHVNSASFRRPPLRLLQPVRHPHLAVYRRGGGEMLLRLFALARAPVELAEAEVAVGDFGSHLVIRGRDERFVETCPGTGAVVVVLENLCGEPLQGGEMTMSVSFGRRCEPLVDVGAGVLVRSRGQVGARRRRPVGTHRRRDPRRISPQSSAENAKASLGLSEQGENIRETRRSAGESMNQIVLARNGERALQERDGGMKIATEKVNVAEVVLGDE